MKKIILLGFYSVGKTSVGKLLAQKLALPFEDSDSLISKRVGSSVRLIHQSLGENRFRRLESEVIKELSSSPSVLAIGGGSLKLMETRLILKNLGVNIYLQASLKELMIRMQRKGLPSFASSQEELEQIAKSRFKDYATHCDFSLATDYLSKKQVVEKIYTYLEAL